RISLPSILHFRSHKRLGRQVKRFRFLRRWMGSKHGVARGVVVYGSPGIDNPDRLKKLIHSCEPLRTWSREHGLALDDEPESLTLLDQRLDSWSSDPSHHGKVDLSNEVGKYLGSVIVNHVDGSQWKVWPNGHPVIQLRSGVDLDVIELANDRINHSGASLDSIYSTAQF
ncbi:MAG TPA: DUF6278 family protein, partial [Acidimicrobiales bacterium]|nr:DUF6278 family protein [Acidimicrobiales bacterium]